MWVWDHKEPTWQCGCDTHIVKWALYGLTPTSSSELFMVSHPHRQVGSLWSHTHIVKWALYGLTPTSSSGLFMVCSLLSTRIFVTIILKKLTWLFHLCLSRLHDHNVHYGLGQPIHSSPVHVWESLIVSLVPSDNHNTRSTCPTSVFTGIGQTLMSRPGVEISQDAVWSPICP
jgi:hypothetical protein